MSQDLNDFLRKAAQRRKDRQNVEGRSNAQPSLPTQRPPEVIKPAILEPIELEPVSYSEPRLKNRLPAQSHLAQEIDQVDERTDSRLHQKFDHTVSSIDSGKKTKGKKTKQVAKQPAKQAVKQTGRQPSNLQSERTQRLADEATDAITNPVPVRTIEGNSMIDMLRNPSTLKMAFIASQIFERKF